MLISKWVLILKPMKLAGTQTQWYQDQTERLCGCGDESRDGRQSRDTKFPELLCHWR